jgi:hypothetical protein
MKESKCKTHILMGILVIVIVLCCAVRKGIVDQAKLPCLFDGLFDVYLLFGTFNECSLVSINLDQFSLIQVSRNTNGSSTAQYGWFGVTLGSVALDVGVRLDNFINSRGWNDNFNGASLEKDNRDFSSLFDPICLVLHNLGGASNLFKSLAVHEKIVVLVHIITIIIDDDA